MGDPDEQNGEAAAPWSSPYGPAAPSASSAENASSPPSAAVPPTSGGGGYMPPPAPYTSAAQPSHQRTTPPTDPRWQSKAKAPGLSVMSMIFGILGLLLACCSGIGFFFAVAAVIMAHISRGKYEGGRGLSLSGLIMGYTGILVSLIAWSYMSGSGFNILSF